MLLENFIHIITKFYPTKCFSYGKKKRERHIKNYGLKISMIPGRLWHGLLKDVLSASKGVDPNC